MNKKSRSLLCLLLVLTLGLLSACGASDTDIKQPASVNGDSSVTTGTAQSTTGAAQNTTGTAPHTTAAADVEVTISETVVYEADGIKVTATGYEDGWMGPEVTFLLENTTQKNVLITTKSVSVNGYMTPLSSLYAEVAAGKKANESMSLMTSELEKSGIETVADIQFYLKVSDGDTWEELATSDLITLSTSASGMTQSVDDSGEALYDEGGIRVVCKGLKQDLVWDGTVVFYMENSSGQPITVYAENVSVNGFMESTSLWADLRDGTKIVDGMSLLDLSDLELESIDEVQTIEFNLRIINSETWDEIATTDVITLNFA